MEVYVGYAIAVICSVTGCTGLWQYLAKKAPKDNLVLGLAHDRIMFLCTKYIERGWVTVDELENLHTYLYVPYKERGGNGLINTLVEKVDKLEVRRDFELKG